MIGRYLTVFFVLLFLSSCNDSPSTDDLPSTEFHAGGPYVLSDFNLNGEYDYWEIREGMVDGLDSTYLLESYIVLMSFDEVERDNLSEQQQSYLSTADSDVGFAAQCLPAYCPIYGVGLRETEVVMLTSKSELLSFLGYIDTEAELYVWLWAHNYKPKFYDISDDGYMVIVAWDNSCGLRGEDLVFVDSAGNITTQRNVSKESYSGCV